MSTDLSRAQWLVADAWRSGERANILLYGVPGTGKTEFSRLLADGGAAISVGEADEDGFDPDREERLAHLGVCRKLVSRMEKAVLVIDEAEDMLLSGRGSKLWLNKLVEDGKGAHVWIVNDPTLLGEPVVRRMDMALRFDVPSAAWRRCIAAQLVVRNGAALSLNGSTNETFAADLADLNTSPAILSAAMLTGARIGETAEGVLGLARDLAEASGRRAAACDVSGGAPFDPTLSVADCDLVKLADKLADAGSNWSLLLSGPPGTGKSVYARYIAQRAGVDVHCVSGSELLGSYVGETEKQIAEAFARAERYGSLLLIDEADSFLGSRDLASRNWEVSMTNEMLRQIERARVRLIATTNRAAALDAASARRFTLHAEFTVMDASKARRLFEVSFGMMPPPALDRIAGLAPGDFAQARRRARLLGETNPDVLAGWLAATIEARRVGGTKIGF